MAEMGEAMITSDAGLPASRRWADEQQAERDRLAEQERAGRAAEAKRRREGAVAVFNFGERIASARRAVESAQLDFEHRAASWATEGGDEMRLERAEVRLARAERDLRRLEAAGRRLEAAGRRLGI